jgi:hypothetical protein
MAENKMVSFNLPSPYQAELAKIADQQRMAEMLQAQSQAPIERFSYKGIEARTPATAGLAKLLQGFGGAYFQGQAREQEKALGEKYRAEQSADFTNLAKMLSAPAVAGSAAVPERFAAPPTTSVDDEGNPMPGMSAAPAVPAVVARRAGQIDPEMIGQFKTPETQQMAMAQLLAQVGPKTPIKLSAGESLINPTTFAPVYTAPEKQEFGTTPQYEKDVKSPTGYVAVLYGKNGERKVVGPADPMNQFTTGTVDAALKRDMDMYQFGNLSADQRASLGIRLTQAGVDVAKLNFDTGLGPARQPALPPNAPVPNFGRQTLPPAGAGQPTQPVGQPVAPVAVPPAPRIGMAPPRSVQPVAPSATAGVVSPSGQPVTEAKPLIDTVTPKERQVLMVAQPQQNVAAQSALQNMERLINVATELKDHPGLNSIVGKGNQYSIFDMTDNATNARALQSTLVKQSAVNALQAMRDASKTGGAVGAVSEKEWPILEQQLAALDGAQTTTAYKAALTNLNNQLTTSSKRVRSAYEQTYGQLKYESTPYQQQTPALGAEIPVGAVRRVR